MSRGYLKNNTKAAGRKAGLGGGSKKCPKSPKKYASGKRAALYNDICYDIDEFDEYRDTEELYDDFFLDSSTSHEREEELDKKKEESSEECPICCNIRPLVKLMKGCNHPSACAVCLREMYINQAQQDVRNYPLKCYHPACDRIVTHAQLRQHNLCRSEKELTKHHRLHVLAKAYKGTRIVAHCPDCDFPHEMNRQILITCKSCGFKYEVNDEVNDEANGITPPPSSTIKAVESIKRDAAGVNNGWARCPRCSIIISKGGGCKVMTCACGHLFYWDDALREKERAPALKVARIERLE